MRSLMSERPYRPTCGIADCLPAPASHPGRRTWRCRHGRRFELCEDGAWEPFLTHEEMEAAKPEMQRRTAAVDDLFGRMGLA